MKKGIIYFFIFFLFLFFNISKVKADSYEITSVSITGNNLYIKGWSMVYNQHNIKVKYTLEMVLEENGYKKEYLDKTWNDGSKTYVPTINQRNDYTDAMFKQSDCPSALSKINSSYCLNGRTLQYEQYISKGAAAVHAVMKHATYNHFYFNLEFIFEIPLDDIKELFETGEQLQRKIHFNIKYYQEAGTHLIFGESYSVPTLSGTINKIGVTERVIDIKDEQLQFANVGGFSNQLEVLVTDGRVQTTTTIGGPYYTCDSSSAFCPKCYQLKFKKNNYYMIKETEGRPIHTSSDLYTANSHFTMYPVSVKEVANPVPDADSCRTEDGGTLKAYLPSFWIRPYTGSHLWLQYDPDDDDDDDDDEEEIIVNPVCGYTDALVEYCCLHPEDWDFCNELKKPDKNATTRRADCKERDERIQEFKYPKKPEWPKRLTDDGYGKTFVDNEACSVTCQEVVKVEFLPPPEVNAGMGFMYPVAVNGSRICAAAYKNEEWVKKMNKAVEKANEEYIKMIGYLKEASRLSGICGSKYTIIEPVPPCPSPYTDSRSGLTCHCNSCETCWDTCYYECCSTTCTGSGKDQTCTESCSTCSESCNPHPCPGSTGISCPTSYSHHLNYMSGSDDCREEVCNNVKTKLWSTAQAEIRTQLSYAQTAASEHNRQVNIINKLNDDRDLCDVWNSANLYFRSPSINIDIQGLNADVRASLPAQTAYLLINALYNDDDLSFSVRRFYELERLLTNFCNYKALKTSDYSSNLSYNNVHLSILNSLARDYCQTYKSQQINYRDVWVKNALADLEYQFSKDYYIQSYTANPRTSSGIGYIHHGRYYYTDFYAMSGEHNFNLLMKKIGPNIIGGNKDWTIDRLFCLYDMTNWIFPHRDGPQYIEYGPMTFRFRQISLDDPFPDWTNQRRKVGANWVGYQNIIKEYDKNPYHIVLTPVSRQSIRQYNKDNRYDSFTGDPYYSPFLRNPIYIGPFIYNR
ncbi:MAG: hypothetical protein ACOXZR_02570 [Bacilli bacterium]